MSRRLRTGPPDAQRRLIEAARNALAAGAGPSAFARMQAYVKSSMPYRGISTPGVRAVCRDAFAATCLPTPAAGRARNG